MTIDRESRIAMYEKRAAHGQDLCTGEAQPAKQRARNRGGRPNHSPDCTHCGSSDTVTTHTAGERRYHSCRGCGRRFKSRRKGIGNAT